MVVKAVLVEVMAGLAGDDAAEQQQGDEVGNCHEGIHAVGCVPHNVKADDAGGERSYEETFHAPDARILVVDDTKMNLVVVEGLLMKTGIMISSSFFIAFS